jgi:hypothetical protein
LLLLPFQIAATAVAVFGWPLWLALTVLAIHIWGVADPFCAAIDAIDGVVPWIWRPRFVKPKGPVQF